MPIKKIRRSYRKTRYILYRETLIDANEHFWAFIGSFIGIGIIAYLWVIIPFTKRAERLPSGLIW